MHPSIPVKVIKTRFAESGAPVQIPKLKGGYFQAKLVENGIEVDNLGSAPFLEWKVFDEAVNAMRFRGGTAEKGNAMDGKLGSSNLPLDSIEGRVAYGGCRGMGINK